MGGAAGWNGSAEQAAHGCSLPLKGGRNHLHVKESLLKHTLPKPRQLRTAVDVQIVYIPFPPQAFASQFPFTGLPGKLKMV